MLVADLVEQVKRQFVDEYDVIIINEDIYAYIYEAEIDIIRRVGANDSTVTVLAAAFPSAVPDSVSIKRVARDGVALDFVPVEELDLWKGSNTPDAGNTGVPVAWYMSNKFVNLLPDNTDPTASITITYNKLPVLMTGLPAANTFTVPATYHTDIKNFCLSKAFSKSGEDRKVQEYMELYDRNVGMRASEAQAPDTPVYKQNDPFDFDYYDWV